jgi:hypothetical protein
MVRTLALAMSLGALLIAGTAQAGVPGDALCKEKKAKATGKKASDLLKAFGKNVKTPDPTKLAADVSKAESKFTKGFLKAEEKGKCVTSEDSGAIEAKVNALVYDLVANIAPSCGDHIQAGTDEECDGTDDGACTCPGTCLPPGDENECTCPPAGCGNDCLEGAEQCDGTDAAKCPGICLPNCVCPAPVCGNGVKEEGEECEPRCEQGGCGDGEICGGFCECVPDVPCDCGSPDPTMYKFTTKSPTQAMCGITDADPPLDELACMGLYLGGGGGSMPVPNMIPDEATVKYNVSCCQGTDLALTAKTQAEAGMLNCSEGKRCSATSENPGAPCRRDRNCPGGTCENRCLFAAPLEVLDRGQPVISVCTRIEVLEDSLGGVNCETGDSFTHLPLDARLFLAPSDMSLSTPGYQACPICFGGTLGVPNSGHCEGGANSSRCTGGPPAIACGDDSDCPPPRTCDFRPCTPQSTSYDAEYCCAGGFNRAKRCSADSECPGSACVSGCTQYPTSHDCPPNPLLEVGVIPISFALTTETSSKTANADGDFCGWCRDVAPGGTLCFEGDPDTAPSPGAKSCPDSATVACRPATYHSDPPVGGNPADILECDDPVPCSTDADCSAPYETCQQRNPGAFRDGTIRNISYEGEGAGDLRTPGSHRGTTVSAFCVGPSFNPDADMSGDVGGPASVALEVDMQLSTSGP